MGLVVGLNTVGAIGTLVTLASVAVLVYVILLAIHVLSLRIEVFPDAIHAAAWPIRRRYPLADGAVTRLRVTPRRGWFGTQLGSFGIEIGLGRVHGGELVDVLRLSPSSSVIMVPTRGTRLAIAPSSEEKLLRALAAAGGVPVAQLSPASR